MSVYCTSFCNQGHSLKTGRPIGHECYIIPPRLLRMESDLPPLSRLACEKDSPEAWAAFRKAEDECGEAWRLWSHSGKRQTVKGRRAKNA
jgi:hypothetical protein